jgi:hypothetical protein
MEARRIDMLFIAEARGTKVEGNVYATEQESPEIH